MNQIFVTGAYSRITQQTVLALARSTSAFFYLSDRPGTLRTDELIEQLRSLGSDGRFLPLDLVKVEIPQDIEEIPPLSGLLLCAATGLVGDLTEIEVARVNCDSQVLMARYLYEQKAASTGLSGVFINSVWGHNLSLPLPHERYGIVATTKNKAELELRKLAAGLRSPHRLNFVVATLVDKTAAQILLERASRGKSQEIAQNLPGGRLPTTQEVGEVLAQVLLEERANNEVFYVPERMNRR